MIGKSICVVLILTISSVIGQEPPKYNGTVTLGGEILLQCSLTPQPGNTCAWSSPDGPIQNNDDTYTFEGEAKCELRIRNIQKDLTMICSVTNTDRRSFYVIVLKSPEKNSIIYNTQKYDNKTRVGYVDGVDNVTCISEGGRPTPTIAWKVRGVDTVPSKIEINVEEQSVTSVVQFERPPQTYGFLPNDIYDISVQCFITYQVVNGSETSIVGITISGDYETTSVTIQKINDNYIICEADGHPSPEIKVQKKSGENEWKTVNTFSNDNNNNNEHNQFKADEQGQYRCIVETRTQGIKESSVITIEGGGEDEEKKDEVKANVGVAIGASLGGIFFVIIVVAISVFLYKKEKLCFAKQSSRQTPHRVEEGRVPNEAHENINLKVDEEKADTEKQEKDKSKVDE